MVKTRGYSRAEWFDARTMTATEFFDVYKFQEGWSHLKESSLLRRRRYLRQKPMRETIQLPKRRKPVIEVPPITPLKPDIVKVPKERFLPRGMYFEYTMWFHYLKTAYNRELDVEVRFLSKKKFNLRDAENKIIQSLDRYNMHGVTWDEMDWMKTGVEPVRIKRKQREFTVIDKRRKRVMPPWREAYPLKGR